VLRTPGIPLARRARARVAHERRDQGGQSKQHHPHHPLLSPATRRAARPRYGLVRSANRRPVEPEVLDYTTSVGKPAAFQALMPPARWALCGNPAAWEISAALIERMPDAQENTTARPSGSGRSAGSKVDSGARTEPGIRSTAVSLGSRTSTSRIS